MSLNKSATRRFSLLAGSSLVAATLSAAAFALTPTAVLAANECAPVGVAPSANGAVADVFTCSGSYQATGITYSSQGNLTLNASGSMNVGAVGVNLTGNGTDSVTFTGVTLTGSSGPVLDATAGSGGITISLRTVDGGSGVGIRAQTTGALNLTVTSGFADDGIKGDEAAIRAVVGGVATITNNSVIGLLSNGGLTSGPPVSRGTIDMTGSTGGVTFNTVGAGRWLTNGANVFSSGNDTVGMLGTGQNWFGTGASVAFGGGTDTFNMTGTLIAEGATITGLEAFNNSGIIYLGAENTGLNPFINDTDRLPNDYLSMAGATFTGSGGSHLYLDVALGGTAQVGCETFTGTADCLDLRGGATAGSTILTLNDVTPGGMLPAYLPQGITVIDVAGGTSNPSHFTLDPASTGGYVNPLYGPAFDRPGAFVYIFRYDDENQRYVLVGQPKSRDLFDYAILSGAAQSIWHLTAETVTARQTDLRDGAEGGTVWLRTAGEVTRRSISTGFDGWDGPLAFDNSYNLYAGTITGGIDLLSGASGDFDYVLGAQIGYVSSSFDLDEAETSGRFTGATGGVYGSLWSDWFFLDGAVNFNGLTLDYRSPGLRSQTTTFVNSIGASAEAGVRTRITEASFAEPLVTLSYVRSSFEEISLGAGEVQPEDAKSIRGALGMRLGSTLAGESVSASYFVTGRAWYEFEGEHRGVVHNPGVDLPFADDFSGAFGEAEAGVNVFNAANTLSGFLTSGVKFKDGYSAVDLALGVRMAW